MMAMMLSHVTIDIVHGHSIYLHEQVLAMQACIMQGEDIPLEPTSIESLIGVVKSTLEERRQMISCTCKAHNTMNTSIGTNFSNLLSSRHELDFKVNFHDQSGRQIISDLFNFVMKRANLNVAFYLKALILEVLLCYGTN